MTDETVPGAAAPEAPFNRRLAILLAMAMFVLVVDTSMMNVSISAVVRDLGTTVSGVQSAIALEALVSAAFILIGSKVGDLFGRKRAYVLGLLGYAAGAVAMTLAQGLAAFRGLHHDLSVVAGGVHARGGRDRDRAVRHQARPRRALHGRSEHRSGRRRPVGRGDGRPDVGHPGVAGGRRVGRGAPGGRPGGPWRTRPVA